MLLNLEQQNIVILGVLALRDRDRRRREREREQAAARERRRRRWWVKPWVLERGVHSQYRNIFEWLDGEFQEDYMSYIRMDRESFHEILERVAPRLRKNPR